MPHIHNLVADGYQGSELTGVGGLDRSGAGDALSRSVSPTTPSFLSPSKDISTDDEIPTEVRSWLLESHGSHKGHLGYEATIRNLFDLKLFRNVVLRSGVPEGMNR